MSMLDLSRADNLIRLARDRFDPDLTESELKVLRDSVGSVSPDVPADDVERPKIRAEFVRWLATFQELAPYIDSQGLRVYSVTFPEELNLQACRIAFPILFCGCTFSAGINLLFAETRGLSFWSCSVEGFVNASGIDVHGSLAAYESRFSGEIRLFGARISGDLHFHKSRLEVQCAEALSADGIRVDGSIQLHSGFTANATIRLRRAKIKGSLDCSSARLAVREGEALSADGIEVGGAIQLLSGFTAMGMIRLRGACIGGGLVCSGAKLEVKTGEAISAHGAEISGGVYLDEGFVSSGQVGLLYARIGTVVVCSNSNLDVSGLDALSLDGAEVTGSVHLTPGFTSNGVIRMRGAKIGGVLDCSGAKLGGKEGDALSAERAEIGGDVLLGSGFESTAAIQMQGAQIKGSLSCIGAKIIVPGGVALCAAGATIGGDVHLFLRFEASGTIALQGIRVNGQLNCGGAKLRVTSGDALSAEGAEIGGHVLLKNGFEATGTIRITNAHIKGVLNCSGAKLLATEGDALKLSGTIIQGEALLRAGFEAFGAIKMSGTRIQGDLDLSGAKLLSGGAGLRANNARVDGNVLLRAGFESWGMISLHGAQIEGDLIFFGAEITQVDCTNLRLAGDMLWLGIGTSRKPVLQLTGAHMRSLSDDRSSWPSQGNLLLGGLSYGELTPRKEPSALEVLMGTRPQLLPFDPSQRVEWLMLQPTAQHVEPQPWIQLSKYLEAKGDRADAKHIVYKFRCVRAHLEKEHWLPRRWAIFFAWLEEAPLRILRLIAATLILGTVIFTGADRSGAMIASVRVLPNGDAKPLSDHYPPFQPIVYSVENGLPLVRLGMDEKWMPDKKHVPQPWLPQYHWLDWLALFNSYWFLAASRWGLILSGWVQATILAAAVADRFKK